MAKDRELEEKDLQETIEDAIDAKLTSGQLAELLTGEGYTKRHFPLDELKRWLEERKGLTGFYNVQAILDKIAELEGKK